MAALRQPALLVLVVVVAAAVAEQMLVLLAAVVFLFTVVQVVVVVELEYWELAQTEPEVLRAVLLGVEAAEVSEAAEVLLEAPDQMVQKVEHPLAVPQVYMVAVAVLVVYLKLTSLAFW
jgi:hypothetical protein